VKVFVQAFYKMSTLLPLTFARCLKPALLQGFSAVTSGGRKQKQAISSNIKDQAKTKTKARFH
jgi:hypothetical protein